MSLTFRLALTYLLVTLVGMGLLGFGLSALVEQYLANQRSAALAAQATIYAELLGELTPSAADLTTLAAGTFDGAGTTADRSVRVFSIAGVLLIGDPALGPFPSRPALRLITSPLPLPASQVAGRSYAAAPISGSGGAIGVVEVSQLSAADDALVAALRRLTVQAALVAALIMALVSFVLARSIARPLRKATQRADAIAAELQAQPAAAHISGDEVHHLGRSLDRLEEELRAYVARIAELEQARSAFYRSMSHELRTPLTAIRGTIENLSDQADAAQLPALERIDAETARLSRLVDDLLRPPDDGRLQLRNRRIIDLGALVAELCELLVGRAERAGIELIWHNSATARVSADRDRLKQALLNLLDNALRHTPPGGRVEVTVRSDARTVHVSVADTGPGVPEGRQDAIWERGVRGDNPGAAGLGLPLVREIIEAHGGSVMLDRQHQPGARFIVTLGRTES